MLKQRSWSLFDKNASVVDAGDGIGVSSVVFPEAEALKMIKRSSRRGHVHYTDIEKKAVATCLSFATSNTVRKQFYHYLLLNGYVERVSRGVYKITSRGEKLSEILD